MTGIVVTVSMGFEIEQRFMLISEEMNGKEMSWRMRECENLSLTFQQRRREIDEDFHMDIAAGSLCESRDRRRIDPKE